MKKRMLSISITMITGAALLFQFQNCSDVDFSSVTSVPGTKITCDPGLFADLEGECRSLNTRTTTRVSEAQARQVDVFLVIDTSGSMGPDNRELSEKMAGFVTLLQSSGIDWQACYTTTTIGSSSGQSGRALTWRTDNNQSSNDIVLSPNANGNIDMRFRNSIGQFSGGGSGEEQGIRAMNMALDASNTADCFRSDAALAVIVISDEDERSCGGRCQNSWDERTMANRNIERYTSQYRALESDNRPETLVAKVRDRFGANKRFLWHSLVIRSRPSKDLMCYHAQDSTNPAFYGIQYENLSLLTGGIIGNICSSDYAVELSSVASRIDETLASMTLECAPYKKEATVTFSPQISGQRYRVEGDKLIFTPALPVGTVVTATYRCF